MNSTSSNPARVEILITGIKTTMPDTSKTEISPAEACRPKHPQHTGNHEPIRIKRAILNGFTHTNSDPAAIIAVNNRSHNGKFLLAPPQSRDPTKAELKALITTKNPKKQNDNI